MRTVDQAHAGLIDGLPPGWAYSRQPLGVIGRALRPLAQEAVRFEQAAEAMLPESDPGQADRLLADYERVLGPDPCRVRRSGGIDAVGTTTGLFGADSAPGAFQARRLSARTRWTARGGASRRFFVGVAAQLGYDVMIQEFAPARYGPRGRGARYGDRLYGRAWAWAWRVHVGTGTLRAATYGPRGSGARYGDPYRRWGAALLECTLRRLAPAHTVVQFAYGATATWDGGLWDQDTWAA